MAHSMKAWLLTWEGTVGPAIDPDRKLVAIVSSRKGDRFIRDLVRELYLRSFGSAAVVSRMTNKLREQDARFRHLGSTPHRLSYGCNPCIYARVVSGLRVKVDAKHDQEILTWTEPPYVRVVEVGGTPVEVDPGRLKSLLRRSRPLSSDLRAEHNGA